MADPATRERAITVVQRKLEKQWQHEECSTCREDAVGIVEALDDAGVLW